MWTWRAVQHIHNTYEHLWTRDQLTKQPWDGKWHLSNQNAEKTKHSPILHKLVYTNKPGWDTSRTISKSFKIYIAVSCSWNVRWEAIQMILIPRIPHAWQSCMRNKKGAYMRFACLLSNEIKACNRADDDKQLHGKTSCGFFYAIVDRYIMIHLDTIGWCIYQTSKSSIPSLREGNGRMKHLTPGKLR